jgi:hypothetical protein
MEDASQARVKLQTNSDFQSLFVRSIKWWAEEGLGID